MGAAHAPEKQKGIVIVPATRTEPFELRERQTQLLLGLNRFGVPAIFDFTASRSTAVKEWEIFNESASEVTIKFKTSEEKLKVTGPDSEALKLWVSGGVLLKSPLEQILSVFKSAHLQLQKDNLTDHELRVRFARLVTSMIMRDDMPQQIDFLKQYLKVIEQDHPLVSSSELATPGSPAPASSAELTDHLGALPDEPGSKAKTIVETVGKVADVAHTATTAIQNFLGAANNLSTMVFGPASTALNAIVVMAKFVADWIGAAQDANAKAEEFGKRIAFLVTLITNRELFTLTHSDFIEEGIGRVFDICLEALTFLDANNLAFTDNDELTASFKRFLIPFKAASAMKSIEELAGKLDKAEKILHVALQLKTAAVAIENARLLSLVCAKLGIDTTNPDAVMHHAAN